LVSLEGLVSQVLPLPLVTQVLIVSVLVLDCSRAMCAICSSIDPTRVEIVALIVVPEVGVVNMLEPSKVPILPGQGS